jgi:hypothetical protein
MNAHWPTPGYAAVMIALAACLLSQAVVMARCGPAGTSAGRSPIRALITTPARVLQRNADR